MKNLLIKSIILGCLLLGVLNYTDKFFIEKGSFTFAMDQYKKQNRNIDIAIFGSSLARCAYDPRLFENRLNLHTYNFGENGQRFVTTIPLIAEILNNNNVKFVVIDIFNASYAPFKNENSKGLQYTTLDNLEASFSKIQSFEKIFGLENLYNMSTTIRNHSKLDELLQKDEYSFDSSNTLDYYNGFFTAKKYFNNNTWEKFLNKINKNNSTTLDSLSKNETKIIDDVIDQFNRYDVEVLFVSSPTFYYKHQKTYKNKQMLVKEYLLKKNINFLDYNDLWDDINLSKRDFKDPHHLNNLGALKVSGHLSKHIKDHYALDKGNDQEFLSNRYFLMDNNFDHIPIKKVIKNPNTTKTTGVEAVYLYKLNNTRYELLFKMDSLNNKNIHYKLDIKLNNSNTNIVPNEFKSNLKNRRFSLYGILKGNAIVEHNGRSYKVFQFNYFDEIKNLSIYVGANRDTKILDFRNKK